MKLISEEEATRRIEEAVAEYKDRASYFEDKFEESDKTVEALYADYKKHKEAVREAVEIMNALDGIYSVDINNDDEAIHRARIFATKWGK